MSLIALLQQVDVNEKIKHAPNSGYLIGVWIGNILPFALIVGVAYYMYSRAKKRQNEE
jgi:formate/nitrite transporter FocA (FNT family)